MDSHHTYFMVNESIPRCPKTAQPALLHDIEYPTTTLIYVIYAVTTLVFATIIAFKYNSVKVFNKKIRTQNISNTLWIIYYISVGVRTCLNAAMYGITTHNSRVHGLLFEASIILAGINAFTLCLSLNHQRKYRSSAPPNPAQAVGNGAKEVDPMLPKMEVVKRLADPAEVMFFILFAVSLVLFFLAIFFQGKEVFVLVFVGSYGAQRLPVFVLSLIIVAHRNGNEGPTRQSKIYLFFAALFHLTNELPVFFWAQILPGTCIIWGGISWIDLLIIFNYVSLVLFFLFLRTEYLRNMEECIWTTVSQIQDTFDFRKF